MTASESSTLAAENEKYDSRGDEHSTHIVEQRTISRQIYLLQSVTVPSHHHSLTISNIWTHIPAPLQPRFMFCAFAIHLLRQAKYSNGTFDNQSQEKLCWNDKTASFLGLFLT